MRPSLFILLALLTAVACSDPATSSDPCPGGGEQILDGDDEFCVFVITETGFLCPARLPDSTTVPSTRGDDFGVCSALEVLSIDRARAVTETALEDGRIGDVAVEGEVDYAPSRVDILWIVDNSAYMCEEQQAVRQGVENFLAPLDEAGVDYQIGVITTDVVSSDHSGRLQSRPGGTDEGLCSVDVDLSGCPDSAGPILRSTDGGGASISEALGCLLTQGVLGDGFEAGLEAAYAATQPGLLDGANAGFLRDDADLALVFLTDENDCSHRGAIETLQGDVCEWEREKLVPVQEYVDHFKALKQGREVIAVSIAATDDGTRYNDPNPVEPSCTPATGDAYAGYRYEEFVQAFSEHLVQDLCEPIDTAAVGRAIAKGL